MKNALIVTFQNAYNYGAILQCFALQEKIKCLNINVSILNYDNNVIKDMYKVFPMKNKNFFKCIKSFLAGIVYFKKINERNKKFENFINNNINLTKSMNYNEIKDQKFNNTILIAGSDQIWNDTLTNGLDDIYYLNFGTEVKRISYAASIGKKNIEKIYEDQVKKLLDKFDYISVREETGKKALNKIIDKNIDVVVDPVLLMNKEEWDKYLLKTKNNSEKYILVYMPNDAVIKIASNIADIKNCKIINISKRNQFGKKEINKCDCDPLEFIQLIKEADCIVTSSFHAVVFSLIYNKKFWVVPPKDERAFRIIDLLKKLNLNHRIVENYDDYIIKNKDSKINFNDINETLKKEREMSLQKLKDNVL